mgnify:CR=1 FL=1
MEPYPSYWEADVVLRDGATAHVRPIRPSDADGIQEMHSRQSPESIYLRFFAPLPVLPQKDLDRFVHVDHHDRVAFVMTIGEEIIGVARYDRIDDTAAEVAFNIADAHQGRGIGSIFLEHLAAAARERGFEVFTAEVLPQNRSMLQVFAAAGYEVSREFDDGVVAVRFEIDPTEKSIQVQESREHRAEAKSVRSILHPGSVVVIGASRKRNSTGNLLLRNLTAARFAAPIAELKALTRDDFKRILTEPEANLIRQNQALLATEDVTLTFTEDAIEALADAAVAANTAVENIGARRLQTVLERVLEETSFKASDLSGQTVAFDGDAVREKIGDLAKNADLSRFIL